MRESFVKFITTLKPNQSALCAEVGVSAGDNALDMLKHTPYNFILVDSYIVSNSTFQFNKIIFTPEQREDFIKNVKQSLAVFGDRAKLLIEDSVVASERFEDGSIDYVYIDAEHDKDNVLRDIRAWWPKIKKGGVMGGHDMIGNGDAGVLKAVEEMFGKDYEIMNIDFYKVKT